MLRVTEGLTLVSITLWIASSEGFDIIGRHDLSNGNAPLSEWNPDQQITLLLPEFVVPADGVLQEIGFYAMAAQLTVYVGVFRRVSDELFDDRVYQTVFYANTITISNGLHKINTTELINVEEGDILGLSNGNSSLGIGRAGTGQSERPWIYYGITRIGESHRYSSFAISGYDYAIYANVSRNRNLPPITEPQYTPSLQTRGSEGPESLNTTETLRELETNQEDEARNLPVFVPISASLLGLLLVVCITVGLILWTVMKHQQSKKHSPDQGQNAGEDEPSGAEQVASEDVNHYYSEPYDGVTTDHRYENMRRTPSGSAAAQNPENSIHSAELQSENPQTLNDNRSGRPFDYENIESSVRRTKQRNQQTAKSTFNKVFELFEFGNDQNRPRLSTTADVGARQSGI